MSENIREKYDNFFKSINEYNIDQKMNNIFNNIISELEGVETTISVLSKLITISRLDDMSREICHYKQHGLLYKNDVEGYDGLYTYLDYNDNSVQMFDFLLDKDGNTKEISIDFLNELGKFEHMQINYNNKKLDKVRVIFNVDNKGKKKLEMTAEKKKINYKRIFTFGSKVNQQVNSEEFLDNIQYSEKINKVLTMINLPKNILGKRKKFNSKELYF